MKYTIEGFSQEHLVKLGLDATDAVILRYIVDFYSTGKMVKISYESEEYFWLKYDALIDELPIIKITNKVALARRLGKFVECGLMKKMVYKHAGAFTYFRLTDVYEGLVSKVRVSTQKYIGSKLKSIEGLNSKVQTNDSSTNNSSTKYNTEIDEVFEYFRTKTGSRVRSSTEALRSKVRARLAAGDTVEDCKKAITYSYVSKIDNPDQAQYIRMDIIFSPSKFGGYVDAFERGQTIEQR